jgi:murein DD-endopeptidase MepM/ murein hydrolase activator NlpD
VVIGLAAALVPILLPLHQATAETAASASGGLPWTASLRSPPRSAAGQDTSTRLETARTRLQSAKTKGEQLEEEIASLDDQLASLTQQVAQARTDDAMARGRAARANLAIAKATASLSKSLASHQLRARSAYMMGPALQVSALADTDDAIELRDKALLLDYVSRATSSELEPLDVAQLRLSQAQYESGLAQEKLASTRTTLRIEGERLKATRKARLTAKQALDGEIADLQGEVDAQRVSSAVIAQLLKGRGETPSKLVGGEKLSIPGDCPVTSRFGMRWGRMHEGIDFGCPMGHPVHAAGPGTIAWAGWQNGYGNLVVIDHGGGISTAYGHNSRLAVHVGQSVERGDVISYVGSTGHSTGPHIHFEVRINGEAVDPTAYLV